MTTKLKHTPGKWRIAYSDNSGPEVITDGNKFIACVELDDECLIDKFEQLTEEQQANALIIAAASDMLNVLIKEYKDRLQWSERGHGIMPHGQAMVMLENIIEKATGLTIEEVLDDN